MNKVIWAALLLLALTACSDSDQPARPYHRGIEFPNQSPDQSPDQAPDQSPGQPPRDPKPDETTETVSAPLPENPAPWPVHHPVNAPRLDLLEREAMARKVRTVGEFLDLVPENMKASYVLLEKSRSIQAASREFPRVIMFTPYTADLILAFNGHPSQKGFDSIEAIEYVSEKDGYEFRRFLLPEGDSSRTLKVERNPPVCTRCHGSDPRPNWEPYNLWTGAIGEQERWTANDRQYFLDFIVSGATHDRYRKLDRQTYFDKIDRDILHTTSAHSFEIALGYQRVDLLRSNIMSSKDYESFKFAIFAAISMCPNIHEYVPARFSWASAVRVRDFVIDTKARFSRLEKDHLELLSRRANDAGHESVSRLRWLLESRGVFIERWGHSLQSKYLVEATSVDWLKLIDAISDSDNELKVDYGFILNEIDNEFRFDFLYKGHMPAFRAFCEDLKAKSLDRLTNFGSGTAGN